MRAWVVDMGGLISLGALCLRALILALIRRARPDQARASLAAPVRGFTALTVVHRGTDGTDAVEVTVSAVPAAESRQVVDEAA